MALLGLDRAVTVSKPFLPVRLALALLLLHAGATTPAYAFDEPTEYQVKAAFLLAFVRFVEWPEDAFKTPTDPLVVCVLGKDPFDGVLDQTVSNKTINGRRVTIHRTADSSAARACHVLFLAASETRRLNEVTSVVLSRGILIVGESEGFAERGGMIDFIVQDNHVRFQINPGAAARAGLRISSKLLQLAILVGDKGQGK